MPPVGQVPVCSLYLSFRRTGTGSLRVTAQFPVALGRSTFLLLPFPEG